MNSIKIMTYCSYQQLDILIHMLALVGQFLQIFYDCKESVEAYFAVDSSKKDNNSKNSISSPATQAVEKP